MTISMNAAATRLSDEERRILVRYAAGGESAQEIARQTGIDKADVALIIDAVAKNNRGLARNIVKEYDDRARAVAAARGVPVPQPMPRPVAAPPAPKVVVTPRPVPQSAPQRAADLPLAAAPTSAPEENIDGVVDLLDAAEASSNPRLQRTAKKIRDLVAELQEQYAEHSREHRLRVEQEELEARLAEVKAKLRGLKRSGTATVVAEQPADPAINPKVVRDWAFANGVECPRMGRVPGRVIDAWQKAVGA